MPTPTDARPGLWGLGDAFARALGKDADADRHGIVTRGAGLLNPNHVLSAAIAYLYRHRPEWPADAAIGKTLVSSSMIDRVGADLGRRVVEVPVGFKWFVPGLLDGSLAFGGEESAGASFLRRDGSVWTTDKDGIILALLASEIVAVTGQTATERSAEPPERFGGHAPGNGAPIGGLKVVTEGGWFAARPSGTEDVYKVYAESFEGPDHLARIQEEARDVVAAALQG